MTECDLVVIGGGTGGLVAAREGRRRHARVVLVQDGPLGGDCTFTGCVPSKALLGPGFKEKDHLCRSGRDRPPGLRARTLS